MRSEELRDFLSCNRIGVQDTVHQDVVVPWKQERSAEGTSMGESLFYPEAEYKHLTLDSCPLPGGQRVWADKVSSVLFPYSSSVTIRYYIMSSLPNLDSAEDYFFRILHKIVSPKP